MDTTSDNDGDEVGTYNDDNQVDFFPVIMMIIVKIQPVIMMAIR